ncbi:hypothetical protein AGABI1DRAFT_83329 [Agaricus bisporus var. burnettii JB137-S8]|uniref:Uncharacterized protein n=1 Tax=Agaricus bisporus var. burnettii (strain JB137-S8 / ATCC MYA-4627 / FGSC 10392) TaxID=597362 RepID=K5X292_AGABU|nr:uncharacterized protein AGABI1DRAFT_83329 [Agaricus bisporus var. burnettii JB137-S8]EKM81936.1 hypothetical protein AGABI1DRAFT_83329 [Agaricus bisporus var. burnettii JB137-S8]
MTTTFHGFDGHRREILDLSIKPELDEREINLVDESGLFTSPFRWCGRAGSYIAITVVHVLGTGTHPWHLGSV